MVVVSIRKVVAQPVKAQIRPTVNAMMQSMVALAVFSLLSMFFIDFSPNKMDVLVRIE